MAEIDLRQALMEQAKSCILTLEAFIIPNNVRIKTPSIIVDRGEDQSVHERVGQINYWEVQQTDEAFTNYCTGLEGLGINNLKIRVMYATLRTKCDETFEVRRK